MSTRGTTCEFTRPSTVLLLFFCLFLSTLAALPALAQRQTVLPQINVPHNYYFREMFLPQLTNGPSGVAWSPDGKALVYSMAGYLWRQAVDSGLAVQLTDGPGLDYQPDWSPDGSSVVFSRYDGRSVELMSLSLEDGRITALTANGAVNTQPRYSPDGKQLAWVSTVDDGGFRVALADTDKTPLEHRMLCPARKSETYRYYYAAWDHELSPSWSPDGKELILVANTEIPYGSGALWRVSVDGKSEPVAVQTEETSWQAQPDWSPDGRRVVYSSYQGRQWHQLWITTADGKGYPFALGYGDYDVTAARFSPDGNRLAFISNQDGDLSLWVQELVGGRREQVIAEQRQTLRPQGTLLLSVVDGDGKRLPARVSVQDADGRGYAPVNAWMRADDAFDPTLNRFEWQYFHTPGQSELALPVGDYRVTVWRGPENRVLHKQVSIETDKPVELSVEAVPLSLPDSWQNMVSADVHVHMNYGGRYRNTPENMVAQARAEDLDMVFNLLVNKEQRIPDIAYFSVRPDPVSDTDVLLSHSQEYHTSFWGHLGLLGLKENYLLPDYVAYPQTGAASLFPGNDRVADLAHAQGALVGYVHPFDTVPDPENAPRLTNALPVNVALGKVDYYEVVGFANPLETAEVWHRLLNCGFRLSAAGGTDAMANYASYRGPVGQNRVYVDLPEGQQAPEARMDRWLAALKAGRSVATNGPLVYLRVNDKGPGSDIALAGPGKLTLEGYLRSNTPVDHLEVLSNGRVVRNIALDEGGMGADFSLELPIENSGWILLRAWNSSATAEVMDRYPYGTTNPVFVTVGGKPVRSASDADYFIAWIDRVLEAAQAHPDYNNDTERDATVIAIKQARQEFEARRALTK